MFLAPDYLQKGDKVYLLSTARKIEFAAIAEAISTIESWGLQVEIGESIGAEENQYAGSDALRHRDFQRAINDHSIRAIICAKGGYGTVRMMDGLDWTSFLKKPKWLCGFSDVTFLQTHIVHQFGIQTIHSPMPSTFVNNTPEAIDSLRAALFGEKINYTIPPHPLNKNGIMNAPIVGGNLSILYSITGTLSGIDTTNKILFIEDLDEYLYHIDRMLMNLKRSGKLQQLKGLLVGGFTDMHDNQIPFGKTAEEIIYEHCGIYDYPIIFNFPAGHIANNHALYLGRNFSLDFV